MNKTPNIFWVILLCVVSYVGLLISLYSSRESDTWNPQQGYAIPKGGRASESTVSVGSNSNSVAVPMTSRHSSALFSSKGRARQYPTAFPQTPSSFQGGTAGTFSSPISHMSSSQTMKPFGGGGNGGSVSMSGGVVKSSNSSVASASGLSVSMPSTSMYAYNANRTASSAMSGGLASSVSGDLAVASAIPYAGIGNTTSSGPLGMSGRRNLPGMTSEWIDWLESDLWNYSGGYGVFGGGSEGVTMDMLRDLYVRATGDTDFDNEELWNSFLAWFNSQQSDDKFGWYWAPISDAVPFVLFLCLVYAFVIYRKTKMAKNVKVEK